MIKIGNAVNEVLGRARAQRIGEPLGVKCGFGQLDRVLDGLNNGDLIILAARPGMGKTTLAIQISANVAEQNIPVLYLSAGGKSAYLCAKRLLTTKVPNELQRDDYGCAETVSVLLSLPLYIDNCSLTLKQIVHQAESGNGIWRLIIVDCLQQLYHEPAEVIRTLKQLAVKLDVPLLLCSQLTREPEYRAEHRPRLSDIKHFERVVKYADSVLLLYREAYYDCEADPARAEIIVAKNHYGDTGAVGLLWTGGTFCA